ncbi:hypothetical protein, partial [Fulvimarina sp. MAC8]|uniref:hypothetical protein n=1 Tax=Fulvimarina sp. MAC8 TaxID=3162874 RepID=UPI0032EAF1DB
HRVKGARIVCPHRATLNQNVIFLMKSVNEETGALPRKRVRSAPIPVIPSNIDIFSRADIKDSQRRPD